ncbi:hypothetical protein A2U01_0082680, partial [Trifolium medium]|nr:hypothetical protein [Trifolium medium]
WMMNGQLVSKLHETLEVEMKLSAKRHFDNWGIRKLTVGKRVEGEYRGDVWK